VALSRSWRAPAALATLLAAAPLRAQDQPPPPPPPPLPFAFAQPTTVSLGFDLGFLSTGGNSDVTTLNFAENLGLKTGHWMFGQTAGTIYGSTAGVTSADQYKAGLRADYHFSARMAAYGLGSFERNRFAGIAQNFEEASGLGYLVAAEPADTLVFETGISFNQQRGTGGERSDFAAGRAAAAYKHLVTQSAFARQALEILPDLADGANLRVNSQTDLVAPLSKKVAIKSSYAVRFDHQPEPGFKRTDRVFTTGVQIVF